MVFFWYCFKANFLFGIVLKCFAGTCCFKGQRTMICLAFFCSYLKVEKDYHQETHKSTVSAYRERLPCNMMRVQHVVWVIAANVSPVNIIQYVATYHYSIYWNGAKTEESCISECKVLGREYLQILSVIFILHFIVLHHYPDHYYPRDTPLCNKKFIIDNI